MPIYDIVCNDCGFSGEVITPAGREEAACPSCQGNNTSKRLTAPSPLTGKALMSLPGPRDTACCGSSPGHAGCAGPGSCCGKTPGA